jgi:hypothetical protein
MAGTIENSIIQLAAQLEENEDNSVEKIVEVDTISNGN